MASARRLIPFDSAEGRESRAASVAYLMSKGTRKKHSGIADFVAALDEARLMWHADDEEQSTWVQCSVCSSWRRGVCGLDAEAWGSFTCAQNTWRPQQASCLAPQEDKGEEEDWEGEEASQGGGDGGGGAEGGGSGARDSGAAGGGTRAAAAPCAGGGGVEGRPSEYYLGDTEGELETEPEE